MILEIEVFIFGMGGIFIKLWQLWKEKKLFGQTKDLNRWKIEIKYGK